MSRHLVSALQLLQINDYASIIIVTSVVYDYVLTFPREIAYIWRRPWTWVSTMFVIVRYVGLSFAILSGLIGSSFIPGPVNLYGLNPDHQTIYRQLIAGAGLMLTMFWELPVFLTAADFVMILRVYALWNQSKWILYILLSIYVPHVLVSFVFTGIYYRLNNDFEAVTVEVLGLSFCGTKFTNQLPPILNTTFDALRFILGFTLLVLVVIQTVKESIVMGGATNQWWPNRYVRLLIQDGIFYFVANAFNTIIFMIQNAPSTTINSTTMIFLFVLTYISMCPILPRFIISIRELYDNDRRGCCELDTGFGIARLTHEDTLAIVPTDDDAPAQDRVSQRDAEAPEVLHRSVLMRCSCDDRQV